MAGNLLAYSGIITKVKAMGSQLITQTDYEQISNLETVSEFIAFLKNHPGYSMLFENTDEHSLHRGDIEHILHNALYIDYAKIYRFASQYQRSALKFIFLRFEVNILKACLQSVFDDENKFHVDISSFREFFELHSDLNLEALSNAKSISEFTNLLKDSDYYQQFIMLQNSSHTTLFDYETALDIYYFKKIWVMKDKILKGVEKKSITSIYGNQIDLLNIMWIYRSKRFYDVDAYHIYASMIPAHYKLSSSQISKMVEATSLEEFGAVLNTTYYHNIYQELFEGSPEKTYENILNKIYLDNKRKYPASIAPVNCYLYQKEREIDHLTTALECIRYKLDPQDILNYISL